MTKNKLDLQKEAGYLKITYLGEYYFLGMKVGELYVYNNQGTKLFDNPINQLQSIKTNLFSGKTAFIILE